MTSVIIPIAYLVVIFGGLYLFSVLYRRHIAGKSAHIINAYMKSLRSNCFHTLPTGKHVDPYYESHPERDAYVTLLQQDPPAPEVTLKAALMRRAIADVFRAVRFREDKPAIQNLLQKGLVGDDLWNSLLAAEKELEGEVREVCAEANTFVEGWGSLIFPTANEVIANERMRAMFESTNKLRAEKGEHICTLVSF